MGVLVTSLYCRLNRVAILGTHRFSDLTELTTISPHPFCRGTAFADNAKQLLIPLLGMPSPHVVAALLFLAYYELGMNNEAGESLSGIDSA